MDFQELEARIPKGTFRTRFAPSPTGYMHIGNLRTALYGYLLAKREGGAFILRIEDTDQERYVEGAADFIINALKNAGLDYDEGPDKGGPVGPYIQSQRKDIYGAYANLLIERGHAYRCFCDKESLEEQRKISKDYDRRCSRLSEDEVAEKLAAGLPYVVRQKIPKTGTTVFEDIIYGFCKVENKELDDQILLKSDGMGTYNFCNVVDDHLMGITHVIRGSEYLSSAPKYNLLYEGFGWEVPVYVHVSMIMKDEHQKLSKRKGDASYEDLLAMGYLKEAVINYIALLGWSPGGEQEKFTLSELIEAFDPKGISKSPAIFDFKKLDWLNGEYLRGMTDEEFHGYALPYIKQGIKRDVDTLYVAKVLKERCERLADIPGQLDFIDARPEFGPELYTHKKMKTDAEAAKGSLLEILPVLEGIADWKQESIHGAMLGLAEKMGVKNGQVLWPLRVAVTGKAFTPGGGIEICVILGKDESLSRVRSALTALEGNLC